MVGKLSLIDKVRFARHSGGIKRSASPRRTPGTAPLCSLGTRPLLPLTGGADDGLASWHRGGVILGGSPRRLGSLV